MDLRIRSVEGETPLLPHAARPKSGTQGSTEESVFALDPDARKSRREHSEPAEPPPPAHEDHRVAPRPEDEAGSHLDLTA